jgi:hypothetical protein
MSHEIITTNLIMKIFNIFYKNPCKTCIVQASCKIGCVEYWSWRDKKDSWESVYAFTELTCFIILIIGIITFIIIIFILGGWKSIEIINELIKMI